MTTSTNDTDRTPTLRRRPGGLGRGLNALLGEAVREEPLVEGRPVAAISPDQLPPAGGLATIPVADIEPHPDQPRRHFAEDALEELAQSIARRGVIQPVIVRPIAGGRYQLVAGERRWRASQRARLHAIPAIVRVLDDSDTLALALIENIQREDLNPVEEAQAYQRLVDSHGLSQLELAKMVDKSRSHVANLMRLLALPAAVLAMVAGNALTMGHARALINVPDAEALANEVLRRKLSVRETEKLVRERTRIEVKSMPAPRGRAGRDPDIEAVERHLEDLLGLNVRIAASGDAVSGSVTVSYASLDQLDLICQRLSGERI